MNVRDLKPGTRYTVTFDDCCVRGEFEAVFVRLEVDDDADAEYGVAIFETARLESLWGYTFTEVPA